jgi:hypothetical protein
MACLINLPAAALSITCLSETELGYLALMSIPGTENALTSLLGILCAFYFIKVLADAVLTIISWLEKHQKKRGH